jgi:1-deoxy-D-xylulose-5-phosphate synthase
VVFAVDRAGLVGEDGETHHGIYDVGFLRHAPGMTVLCPASLQEQSKMLEWAVKSHNGPVAIRYPRGGNRGFDGCNWKVLPDIENTGALSCHRMGADVTLITYGTMISEVLEAAELLAQQGIEATVLRLLTVSPLPVYHILTMMSNTHHVVTVEEIAGGCGIREELAWQLQHLNPEIRLDGIDLGRQYITHGDMKSLYQHYGLDAASIAAYVQEVRQS